MVTRRKRKANSVNVDLSNVEARVLVQEGEHKIKVVEVSEEQGDKAPYLKWIFEVVSKTNKGGKVYYNTSLAPQALWNLRSLLEALEYEIPDSAFDLDFEELVDLECMVEISHEKYEGRPQAKPVNFWSVNDAGEEEEEEEEAPKKTSAKKASRKAEPEEDEEEEEEKPRRGKRSSKKEEPEDEEDEEEEEEEEGEAPKKSKATAKKSSKKKASVTQDEINEMSQEELEDVIKEHDLDCDLSEHRTLRKMRQAVIDAAEEAGALSE